MKKLFLIIGLCVTFPVFAMELIKKEDNFFITQQDNLYFAQLISTAVLHDNKMIQAGKLSSHNSLYLIVDRMAADWAQCDNNIAKLIKKNSLQYRLNEYMKIDADPLIQMRLEQIQQGRGDIQKTQDYVIKTRQSLAQLLFKKKQPNFQFLAFDEERLSLMLRNQYYPTHDAAFNDWTAWVIYTYIFAKR